MRKKLLRFLCTALLAVTGMSANAQTSGSCGDNATWEYDNGTLTISGTGAMADYTDALTDNPWNAYRESITNVVIGDDITHIGNWAFMGCTSLASVTLGESISSIGAEAFANCTNTNFKKLNIPNSVETIGAFAFSNITNLTYVCIGSGVTSIGVDAFSTNSNMKYIGCYASAPPTIGSGAFSGVTPTAIYVPTDYIGDYQTADGWSTFSAVIGYPHGNCGNSDGDPTDAITWSFDMGTYQLTLAGTGAIKTYNTSDYPWNNVSFNPMGGEDNRYWTAIQSITLGEGITNVPDWAFAMQMNCRRVSLPSTLKSIGWSSLEECAFTSIYLPEGLETIGDYAFYDSKFETICLPSTITSIGAEAFLDCSNLTSIGCYAATPPTLGSDATFDFDDIVTVYVPSAKVNEYKAAERWSTFGAKIQSPSGNCGPDGNEDKATWSYEMATRTLTIEGTEIKDGGPFPWESFGMGGEGGAFNPDNNVGYPCGIENVVIGEGITEIPGSAFYMEVGIKNLLLPSTLSSIGIDAFGECEGIEVITCDALTPPTLGTDGSGVFYENDAEYNQVKIATLTAINVPAASVAAYKAADGWKEYADKIVAQGGGAATTTTFTYTATAKETKFDTFAKFTGATAVKSHDFADGAGTVVYEGTVTEIQGDAFRAAGGSNTNLTSITIPESVTSLAANALRKSTALTTVNFAGTPTLTTIGNYVFASCSALANITLPASVTTIGGQAFSDCTALTTFDVPEGVTSIGGQAFGGCSNLTAINFTGTPTLTSIGGSAFYNCKKLTTLTLPESLTTIGNDVFNGAGITSVFIPKNVSDVGAGLSYGCEIASITVDPDNAKYDSRNDCNAVIETATNKLVAGCLNTVIPDGIVTLGTFAFAQFQGTFSLTIPESVTSFESGAIHMCPGLTTVNIPSGITSMDDVLFGGCNCTDVYCYIEDPTTLTWGEGGAMAFANAKATKFHVKEGTLADWETAFPDANVTFVEGLPAPATTTFTYTATEKVTAFDEYANFTGATALASHDFADGAGTVVYNGTVTALESGAFYYNNTKEALTAITLPESLTALGDDAFRGCTGLTTVTFDGTSALTIINKRAFQGCSSLATIAIPASVETIGSSAFTGCSGLASVTFPGTSALTTIGTTAFSNCASLTTITLPESVTTIGEVQISGEKTYYNGSVFSGAGLTSFVVPKNLTTIYGGGHFRNCPITSLTVDADNAKYEDRGSNAIIEKATDKLVLGCVSTTVPDGIKTIGYEAFFAEEQPFALTLPESVTAIEARAFHYATGLTAINIPSKVTEIPAETFAQCNLTELVIPDGVTSIGGMAFMMCMNLKTITFGSGLTTLDNWAFECPNVTDVYCYADPFTTWNGSGFADGKATKFHVADADAWSTAFPDANVTFVGDLAPAIAGNAVDGVYWATYYNSAANMKADANTTVYKAAINGNSLTLTEIDDKVITARQAVILKSTGASIAMTVSAAASADDYSGNVLEGVDAATAVDDNYKYYVLSNENSTLGFYKYTGETLGANKAFYKTNATGAPEFFAFGETTGIGASLVNREERIVNSVYNLAGQRVAQPTKGLYIVNGKKVVIK